MEESSAVGGGGGVPPCAGALTSPNGTNGASETPPIQKLGEDLLRVIAARLPKQDWAQFSLAGRVYKAACAPDFQLRLAAAEEAFKKATSLNVADSSMTLTANQEGSLNPLSRPPSPQACAGVKQLRFSGSVTAESLKNLSLPDVKVLCLPEKTDLTAALVAAIKKAVPGLVDLDLGHQSIVPAEALDSLADLPNLRGIAVNALNPEGVSAEQMYQKASSLEGARVSGEVSEGLIKIFCEHVPAMRLLFLPRNGYEGKPLAEVLQALPGVEHLGTVDGPAELGDAALRSSLFGRHPWLRKLGGQVRSDDAAVVEVSGKTPDRAMMNALAVNQATTSLDLWGCQVSKDALQALGEKLKGVVPVRTWRRLSLFQSHLEGSLSELGPSVLEHTRMLDVSSSNVPAEDVATFKHLQHLRADGCAFVNDAWLRSLCAEFKLLPELRSLMLSRTAVTDDVVTEFKKARPRVNVVLIGRPAMAAQGV